MFVCLCGLAAAVTVSVQVRGAYVQVRQVAVLLAARVLSLQ
jgi:hypothetical protein